MADRYRLLVVDLDGTLLGRKREIEPALAARFSQLCRIGVGFTIATGRLYRSAAPYVRQLGVSLPVVASSGADIRDPATGQAVRRLPVPPCVVSAMLDAAGSEDVTRYLVMGDDLATDSPGDETAWRYAQLLGVALRPVADLAALASDQAVEVLALIVRGEGPDLDRLQQHCYGVLPGRAQIIRPFPHLLEILHPDASKGSALEFLSSVLDVPMEQIIAIGDGPGDLDMIRVAGLGAFVANAGPELGAQCDYQAGKPGPDGVAEVIDRFLLGRH